MSENNNIERKAPDKITKFDLFLEQLIFMDGIAHTQGNTRKGGLSFSTAMGYILHKFYKNKDDLAEALTRHMDFYMTDYAWGGCINGLIISMEEQRANDLYENGESTISPDLIRAVKTGLMGPLAGFGDTIVQTVFWVITIGYAQPLAMAGNFLAVPISWLGIGFSRYLLSWLTCFSGYYSGREAVSKLTSSKLAQKVLTVSAVVAMCIMGALTAGNVNFVTAVTIGKQSLHELVDSLLPGISGLAPVFIIYYLFKKKKIHIAKIMIGIIVICIILGILGLFG